MHKKIVEYKILESAGNGYRGSGANELARLINDAIEEGFQPYGPMIADAGDGETHSDIYQPMVKYADEVIANSPKKPRATS